MARQANPKLVGAFVAGALALAVAAAIAFGGTQFLAPKAKAVLFFADASSLSGLDVGSPVTFRGVKVGSVTGVVIHYDVDKQSLRIPVYIDIELSRIQIVSGHREIKSLQVLVERGLRGQLVIQSLVTGQAIVEFNFHPDTPITLVGAEPGMIELPTIPSDIDLLKANITSVLAKIAELPLAQIASQTLDAVKAANELLGNINARVQPLSDELKTVSDQATLTLKEMQSRLELREGEPMQNLNLTLLDARLLFRDLDKNVTPLASGVAAFVQSAIAALDQAQRTLHTAQATLSPESSLYFQLTRTLREIQSTATSIRAFADYVKRHPDSLLTGKR